MANRHLRRQRAHNAKKAIKGIAKATGRTEPTANEQDPAYLAMQLKALIEDFQNFGKAYNQNLEALNKGFSMVDVHQQVLLRVVRDLSGALVRVRKLQVDGDVNLSKFDFEELKLHDEGTLNLGAYYQEYRETAEAAGPAHADIAVVLWSKGASPEVAVQRATVEKAQRVAEGSDDNDLDYETEFFGGNSGQNHQQQESAAASADG